MTKETSIRILYVIILISALLFLVSPFVIPIFFAATISLTLHPILEFLVKKGLNRKRAAALLTALFGIVISIPLFFFVIKGTIAVIRQLEKMSLNDKLQDQGVTAIVTDLRQDFVESIHVYSQKYEFLNFLNEAKINQYITLINTHLLSYLKTFAGHLPTYFILLIIMIICTYSFLTHARNVRILFRKVTGFSEERMEQLTHIFIKNSRQVYLTNLATGGIQSLIVASTVALLQLGDFFVVFFVTLILSFIPVVGAAPVAFVFAIVALITGKMTPAIILGVVGAFTGIIDNILRPWLATFGESRIPTVVAFICVIGGALWLGFPGLFLGLLLGSIAFDTLPIFWEEINRKK
ncbi:MAG: AI-2E family transporter [Bacteriovoracia bacterium]